MSDIKTIPMKMIAIMDRVDSVLKLAKVSITATRNYSAVSHDDIAALLHPEFVKEKIWVKTSLKESSVEVTQKKKHDKDGEYFVTEYLSKVRVIVTYVNAENPSEREDCEMCAYAIDSGDKGIGKAISMAVKYVHLKNFTLESIDEEERRDGYDYQESKKAPSNNSFKEFDNSTYKHTGGADFPMNDKQRDFIIKLCAEKKQPLPKNKLSAAKAKDLIEKLLKL